jgi:hypothetical protein
VNQRDVERRSRRAHESGPSDQRDDLVALRDRVEDVEAANVDSGANRLEELDDPFVTLAGPPTARKAPLATFAPGTNRLVWTTRLRTH